MQVPQLLCDYVAEQANALDGAASPRERRAVVLLPLIADAGLRMQAALAVLRCACPPYSADITALMDRVRTADHRRTVTPAH